MNLHEIFYSTHILSLSYVPGDTNVNETQALISSSYNLMEERMIYKGLK